MRAVPVSLAALAAALALSGPVQAAEAGEFGVGGDAAGDQVGVGDRRRSAASPVAGRPGVGAGAGRAHHQRATRVDPGDGATARPDGVHVERGQADGQPGDVALGGAVGSASSNESRALKAVWHCPQRTLPARALSCSGVTRKTVWHSGQRVCIA